MLSNILHTDFSSQNSLLLITEISFQYKTVQQSFTYKQYSNIRLGLDCFHIGHREHDFVSIWSAHNGTITVLGCSGEKKAIPANWFDLRFMYSCARNTEVLMLSLF